MAKRKIQKKHLSKRSSQRIKKQEKKEHVKDKKILVKLAGALYTINGVISVLFGLAMFYFSYSASGFVASGSSILMPGDLAALVLGITMINLGVVEFMVGFGLWRFNKWAGTFGLVLSVITLIFSIPYAMVNPFGGVVNFGLNAILILLIYSGRKELSGIDFKQVYSK